MVTSDININTDAEITVPLPDHPMDLVEDLQPVPTAPQFQVPDPEYGPNNPQRSKRTHKLRQKMNLYDISLPVHLQAKWGGVGIITIMHSYT